MAVWTRSAAGDSRISCVPVCARVFVCEGRCAPVCVCVPRCVTRRLRRQSVRRRATSASPAPFTPPLSHTAPVPPSRRVRAARVSPRVREDRTSLCRCHVARSLAARVLGTCPHPGWFLLRSISLSALSQSDRRDCCRFCHVQCHHISVNSSARRSRSDALSHDVAVPISIRLVSALSIQNKTPPRGRLVRGALAGRR